MISRIADWDDKRSAPLFGDGAGAVVLGAREPVSFGAIGPIVLGADGSHAETIVVGHDDRKLDMDGPEVYRHAVARMGESTLAAVEQAGLTLEDIDLFVYHQANARITRALGERLGLASGARRGRASRTSATPRRRRCRWRSPTAERDGRLKPGARVLLGAFGAGFTWGAGVIEWGGGGERWLSARAARS